MDRPLQGERVAKSEQVSKNRYHNEVKITSPDEVDAELIGWLKEAYALTLSMHCVTICYVDVVHCIL